METIQITKENALKAYKKANKEGKALLTDLIGENVLNQKITERVKTFNDACDVLGINTSSVFQGNEWPDDIAYKKLKVIVKALNEGWNPDFSNKNESKYYPWFKFTPGVGFSYDDFRYVHTLTVVGSRLCYKTAELAEYAAKQFKKEYNEFLN